MIALLLIAQTLRIAVPLALAAVGGVICERSGVVNIALEGMLLIGAFGYALAAWAAAQALGITGQEATLGAQLVISGAGVAGALVGGALLAAIHAAASINFRADQVVAGVALNILAAGLTKFLLTLTFHSSSNSEWVFGLPSLPGLAAIPTLGSAVGAPLFWLAVALLVAAHAVLFKTVRGLRTRAVGEHPAAAEAAGIGVYGVRWVAVIASGLFAALGGAWLAADQHHFTQDMSAGRGYIALAAVIFGKWRPGWAAAACLLFAGAESVQILLQGTWVPTDFLQVLPHTLALVVLAGAVGKAVPPAADGKPYPEEA